MKLFLCILLLVLPLVAEPLSEKQILDRIQANQVTDSSDHATALKFWQDALVASKAATQSIVTESKIRSDLTQLESLSVLKAPSLLKESASISDHEAFLTSLTALIESNESQLKKLAADAEQAPVRMAALTESLAQTQSDLEDLEIPVLGTGEVESARYEKALQTQNLFKIKLNEIAAEQELSRRESDLFTERVIRRRDHLAELNDLKKTLSEKITKLKTVEIESTRIALEKSAKAFEDVPQLKTIVDEVSKLNARWGDPEGLQADLQKAKNYTEEIQITRDRIQEQYGNARNRIELLKAAKLGVDDETGLLLRQQRARLPSTDELSLELRENLEHAAKAQLAVMALSDRINTLPVLNEKGISELVENTSSLEVSDRSRIRELLDQRSKILRDLSAEYRNLNAELTKGTEASKLTISEISSYSNYIDERLLWIKSTKPVDLGEPLDEWQRIVSFFSRSSLEQVWASIQSEWLAKIISILVAFLASLAIFLRRRPLLKSLGATSEEAARRNCVSIMPTLKNICASILLSLWFPLLLFIAAELIERPLVWHKALFNLSVYFFLSSLVLKFTRLDGLFISHFKMPPDRASLIHTNFRRLVPIAVPFVALVTALTASDVDPSSGRLVFSVGMVGLAVFLHSLFHPKRSIMQKKGGASGVAKGVYFVVMAIPVVFIIGACLGYFASVLTLRDQFLATLGLLVLAFVVTRFLMRWTLVSRRRLAISQALRRREAAMDERERALEGGEKGTELPSLEEVKAEAVNVVEVGAQTAQLLRLAIYAAVFFGLWGIWSSTLPALSFLDESTVWGDTGQAAAPGSQVSSPSLIPDMTGASSASSEVPAASSTVDDRVSLQDIFLSIVLFTLTFIAARNIPGLLSLTLFSRINLGPGGNFALTTTVRYLIVLVGVVLALSQIGITWGKVQWLAAAVTLGIGFGLQEIFANFVAGIIMLFERPVRLGDVVTVGDISGRVTQIKIRATTIQQFNNRELLVPNKEFITSQLVNWTLKDSVLRFEVAVGIAYGSDTKEAADIFKTILKDHPKVLDDPKPDVLFIGFGNSTLDFNLRGFVTSVNDLVHVRSDLHYCIDNALREAGIEIAFPQQDIHLRSLPEGVTLTPKS